MTIDRRAWSPEEHDEYEAVLSEIVAATTETGARIDEFERRLADAVQAHRTWARDLERAFLRKGMANEIKSYQDRRQQALVSHEGRVLSLPKVQGRLVREETGKVAHQRELIELWTWDQILAKRASAINAQEHQKNRIAYFDKLLALRDLCPESASPQDAADQLGIALDTYLTKPEAGAA